MNILAFIDLLSFIVYLGLGIYILSKNPGASINRVFFGLISCFGLWAFSSIFFDHPEATRLTALRAVSIASLGWVSFASFVLLFFLIFTKKKKILRSRFLYPLLIIIPLIFIYQQLAHHSIISDCISQPYGWSIVWSKSVWKYLFFLYYTLFGGGGLLMGLFFCKNTADPAVRHQSKIIFVTGVIAFILGSVFNVLLPESGIYKFPPIAYLSLLIWISGVAYVIVKYRFLTITPAIAADNIVSIMAELLILLDPSGTIVNVNQATLDLIGYKKNELEGKPFSLLPSDKNRSNQLLKKIISENAVINEEILFKTKDGEDLHIILSGNLLKDERGETAGIVCLARDFTKKIKIQKELLSIQRLEALRTLAGGIAHKFNNQLFAISGSLELLKVKLPAKNPVEKSIDRITAAVDEMSSLTYQFLAYARDGDFELKPIRLGNLVAEALPISQHGIDRHIRVETRLDKNTPFVQADYSQFQMVLHVLLRNAAEAMEQPGSILISTGTEVVTESSETHDPDIKPGKYVFMKVSDSGKGMDEKTREKIFEPFFSTKFQGRGLGMAAVYGVVKNHNGHILVDSKPGEGTIVSIFLPVP